ncbi:MAG: alpha-L-fucosidase [Humisphaera sp.]|nr:alpha-L-fucosidase [Humisphaera sp.]
MKPTKQPTQTLLRGLLVISALSLSFSHAPAAPAAEKSRDEATVKAEHGMIGLGGEKVANRTKHPDAHWYPDAGMGLFLHWSICSVREMNISWPMIPGRALGAKRIDDEKERDRIIKEADWNLNGKPPEITPIEYWSQAKDFNPQNYDPDKWCKAAKEAGFTYVVLTARHHDGFAMWPSKFGEFNTTKYMGGKDLIKPYVEACRNNGLKVGIYYSPPDWHFDQEYMSFLYHGARRKNPELPNLGPDLKPRELKHSKEETAKHEAAFARHVKGQIEELLTNYGKIDLLWFDGRPAIPDGEKVITIERIRELQPGIVVNPRLHRTGDYITFERKLTTDKVQDGWAEFCNTWANNWSYVDQPMRHNGFVLGQLVQSRSQAINYLLGIGPMKTGELSPQAYENMKVLAGWMEKNGASIRGTKPLPSGETASVPATAKGTARYLFAIPQFKEGGSFAKDYLPPQDTTLTLSGISAKPAAVRLLGDAAALEFAFADNAITVKLPASKRTNLVDVVHVELSNEAQPAASAAEAASNLNR